MEIGAGKTVFCCEGEHSNKYVSAVKPYNVQGDSGGRVIFLVGSFSPFLLVTQALRVSRGIALLFSGTFRHYMGVGGQPHAPAVYTPRKDPVPIVQEAGWAPGPVWTGEKSRPHRDFFLTFTVLSVIYIGT